MRVRGYLSSLAGKYCYRYIVGVTLLVGCWLPAAGSAQPQVVDGIAAIVNDEIITIGDVRDAMSLEAEQLAQSYNGSGLQERMRALYRQTLRSLTDAHLQIARARQLQLRVTDEEVERQITSLKQQNQISDEQLVQLLKSRGLTMERYRKQVQDGLLIAKVVNAEVRSRLVVLESELRELYQKRQDRYKVAGTQTISHIFFPVPTYASQEEEAHIKQKAETVLQQLRAGADFAMLARQISEGPSAQRGGLLGTFQPGELLPGFEDAVSGLKPGQVSNVTRTEVGWHIIRLEERQSGSLRPFEEVQEELKEELLRSKTEGKYQEWIEALRQQSYVKILYEG